MQELIERFIGYLKMKNVSAGTVTLYSFYLKKLSEEIKTPAEITLGNLSKITAKHEWNKPSVGIFLRIVSSFCGFLENENVIQRNPLRGFATSKLVTHKRYLILTDKEIAKITEVCDRLLPIKENIAIRLLCETGVRRSELLNIQVKNIDLKNRAIYLEKTKGGIPRVVFFSKSTAEKISGYTKALDGEYLLPKMASTLPFVIKKVISLAFPMDTEKAKEITAHSFRHSFATSWLQNNRHPVVLKKLMGWQSLNMLNVYEHLQVGKLQQEYNSFLKKR